MTEIQFVNDNETKWKTLEKFIEGQVSLTPDELASYYMDVIDDLSYAKTFYPKSTIIDYLNQLSSSIHRRIYITKKEDRSRFISFWTEEIPLAIKASHKELLLALIIFLVGISIGAISNVIDSNFTRSFLGDYYVDMTIDNIEKGDPMGVYRDENKSAMTYRIGSNNIQVGLLCFSLGLISAILSGFFLIYNGIMVGTFQTFFIQRGLGWISFSTIFIHGALELSAIVIIAGAGIVAGNSWWYPGTYSRMDSLKQGMKRAVKILIAIIPVFVLAAILESYVTHRYQEMSDLVRSGIIILSFAYIAWYFVYLPIQVSRKLQFNE